MNDRKVIRNKIKKHKFYMENLYREKLRAEDEKFINVDKQEYKRFFAMRSFCNRRVIE